MKCRSVACIWSGTPPVHRVTATASLNDPPTLYTGGSDGSILWWNLSNSDSHSEIKPFAMLCGHAAPIADLDICCPVVVSGEQNTDYSKVVATAGEEESFRLGWEARPSFIQCLGIQDMLVWAVVLLIMPIYLTSI